MSFESITQQTQSKYALRDTMKASSCAIEDWDSAVKLVVSEAMVAGWLATTIMYNRICCFQNTGESRTVNHRHLRIYKDSLLRYCA